VGLLVTGGCGFIGSHVCEHFARLGYDVISIDDLSRQALAKSGWKLEKTVTHNWSYLSKYKNIRLLRADVTRDSDMKDVRDDVDYVIHTAAQTATTTSVEDPRTDFVTNAFGTFNMLEFARRRDAEFAYCSTNQVYGNAINSQVRDLGRRFEPHLGNKGTSEDEPVGRGVLSPYGCSKLAGDLYVSDYSKTYGMVSASFRLSCIYGIRQFGHEEQGWIVNLIRHFLTDQEINIYGTGKQVRDILYVSDLTRVFELFHEKRTPGTYNIGGGYANSLSLLEFIDFLKEKYPGRRPKVTFKEERLGDKRYYVSDISKAGETLGWHPLVPFEEGINRVVDWVRSHIEYFM